MRLRLPFAFLALTLSVLLAACASTQPDPVPDPDPDPILDPVIAPAGPLEARVGTTVTFEVENIDGAVTWTVNDAQGGAADTGTVADGVYQAPPRVPAEPTVTVAAHDAADATRQASAQVEITAPGTLYVLENTVHVYGDLDTVDGNVAPDRSFTVDGVTSDYYDMAMAPALDMAFISVASASPNVFRVADIASAEGAVDGTGFDSLTYQDPSGLAYDQQRDILYVQLPGALLAYHDAATAPAGTEPTRIISGPSLDAHFAWDARIVLDAAADRLFLTDPYGFVAVWDAASTISGETQPDRLIEIDASFDFFWGAAYDTSRDELYLGDQSTGVGIHVIAAASTADGPVAPARSIGGPENPFNGPSQIGYDVANDRLVVIQADNDDVRVFDEASTLDGDVAPSRVIGGDQLPISYPYSGYLDPTM